MFSKDVKRYIRGAAASFFMISLIFGGSSASAAPVAMMGADNPVVSIVKNASPAVVNIDVETKAKQSANPFPFFNDPFFKEFFGEEFREFSRSVPMKGRGSGFIVSKEGHILTNNHVVDGVDKITVTLSDGKTYPAKVVGKDPTFDLAVISIKPNNDLPVLDLGDSDSTEVGEWVVAIGNPYGLEHSVTVGVISAKNRSIHARDVNFDGFLQTDAAINPGNSGGPLLNMAGQVVGINTAILPYAQGLGFAIPVNMAKQIMNDLVAYGKVSRGWLGISVQALTPEFAEAYGVKSKTGVIVGDVFPDSAAEKAGLQRGDVVTAIDGEEAKDNLWFVNKVRGKAPGSEVKMTVIRGGKELTLTAKLNERPEDADKGVVSSKGKSGESDSKILSKIGLSVANPTDEQRQQYNLKSKNGIIITDVAQGSAASSVGLRKGDMLVQVNGKNVNDVAQLSEIVSKDSKSVVLLVERNGRTFFVVLENNEEDTEQKN